MLLKNKDIQNFYGVAASTASRYKQVIIDSLGVKKKHLTIIDLAKYEGIDIEIIQKRLKSIN